LGYFSECICPTLDKIDDNKITFMKAAAGFQQFPEENIIQEWESAKSVFRLRYNGDM
jgi:hypothetical protein